MLVEFLVLSVSVEICERTVEYTSVSDELWVYVAVCYY